MRYICSIVLAILSATSCFAYPIELRSYDEMMASADLVVIASVKQFSPITTDGFSLAVPNEYAAVVKIDAAEFTIATTLKGKAPRQLIVEHFVFDADTKAVLKAVPRLAKFRMGIHPLKGDGWAAVLQFEYLMFLRRLPNGNYCLTGGVEQMHQAARVVLQDF